MNISEQDIQKLLLAFRRLMYSRDVMSKEDREVIDIINRLLKSDK